MAATATTPGEMPPATRNNRGKDLIHWSEGVWKDLDCTVLEEMMRARVVAKFLPQMHVDGERTNVAADVASFGSPFGGAGKERTHQLTDFSLSPSRRGRRISNVRRLHGRYQPTPNTRHSSLAGRVPCLGDLRTIEIEAASCAKAGRL